MGKSSATLPVNDIMTPESKLMTVVPQQSVFDVMKMMMKYNFRHVPVVCTHAPGCSAALPAAALRFVRLSDACLRGCCPGADHMLRPRRWTAISTWA